jgi:hypothetical protein
MAEADHRWLRALPLASAVFLVIIGVVLGVLGYWRRGAATMAAASTVALVLRVVLPGRYVGPLAVRSRRFDVTFLLALTILLVAAAIALLGE